MKRPQWILISAALFLVIVLYAATGNQIFGTKMRTGKPPAVSAAHDHPHLTIDSILYFSRQNLTEGQLSQLESLNKAAPSLHAYHQLARFWRDTGRLLPPYAWYTAEAARLENSEKSLTFAARLFLEGLRNEQDHRLKEWEAEQAKDLFQRSLKINPSNDSSKVSLGAVYLYGGVESPMTGINLIREVVAKDSTNIYAQMTLGEASLVSGQIDKAIERFKVVNRLEPKNLEAIFRLADIYAQKGEGREAVQWYRKTLPLIGDKPELKKEVEARIAQLQK